MDRKTTDRDLIDDLESSLRRRFRTADDAYVLGSRELSITRPASAEELISEEDFERDERLPYWADIWPSGQVLATRLLAEVGGGRSLLDLGCGVGFVSSAAAVAGFDVEASDYYADALLFAQVNAFRSAGRVIATRLLDWRAPPPDLPRFDCVVGSDVLYERGYGTVVSDVLGRTLKPSGIALIADPGRVARGQFVDGLAGQGLRLADQTDAEWSDGKVKQTIAILEVRRVR